MRFHVRVEHGFVDARIAALWTLERFGIEMIASVIFEMMFVFGDERAVRAGEQLFGLDVRPRVLPKIEFTYADESALRMFAFVRFQFALGRHPGHSRISHFIVQSFIF